MSERPDWSTFGKRLAWARCTRGYMTQQDLANVVAGGRSPTISKWESYGEGSWPSSDKLALIIEKLDVNPDWLMFGRGRPERTPPDAEIRLAVIRGLAAGEIDPPTGGDWRKAD